MEKIVIWYSPRGGNGDCTLHWFLTKEKAEEHQLSLVDGDGWGELTHGSVETFVGSDIHLKAIENEESE